MNFLAHAVLSFDDPGILTGNMISDFVKGKKKFLLPERILSGVDLHRAIDSFTDQHPVTREAKQIFQPVYRLYSGAFVDVAYDHFLATDPNEFDEQTLLRFSGQVYRQLESSEKWHPAPFARMFPYMRSQNWLFGYRNLHGVEQSFGGLVRRAAYLEESGSAAILFRRHYDLLAACYRKFFPELKTFAREHFDRLNQIP